MSKYFIGISLVLVTVLCFSYFAFYNYVEPTETGIAWNPISGKRFLQKPGRHITALWVRVSRIDLRPQRICVTSAGRGFNCRLVQFNPIEFELFVRTEGFYYYWWANRLSFNYGYPDEYRGMRDLLRGYAYGVRQYAFVKTIREFRLGE